MCQLMSPIHGRERDEYTLVKFQSYIHSADFANPSSLRFPISSSALNQNFPHKPPTNFSYCFRTRSGRASRNKSRLTERRVLLVKLAVYTGESNENIFKRVGRSAITKKKRLIS